MLTVVVGLRRSSRENGRIKGQRGCLVDEGMNDVKESGCLVTDGSLELLSNVVY